MVWRYPRAHNYPNASNACAILSILLLSFFILLCLYNFGCAAVALAVRLPQPMPFVVKWTQRWKTTTANKKMCHIQANNIWFQSNFSVPLSSLLAFVVTLSQCDSPSPFSVRLCCWMLLAHARDWFAPNRRKKKWGSRVREKSKQFAVRTAAAAATATNGKHSEAWQHLNDI